MGLSTEAINDAADIISNEDDFGVPIILQSPDGEVANIIGLSRKISQRLDQSTGMVVNSKNASVTVHEKTILTANPDYPIRDKEGDSNNYGEVNMRDHIVKVADSTGIVKTYKVLEPKPNETTGSIVLILGDHTE
jgi:hypothetical protein